MELLNYKKLDSTFLSVVSNNSDSLKIAVVGNDNDSFEFSISITNGKFSDTLNYKILVRTSVTVLTEDTTGPQIRLADDAMRDKKINSSDVIITTIVHDFEAGIESVKFKYDFTSIDAVSLDDSTYIANLTNLIHGKRTEITIIATDKSIKKILQVKHFISL